MRLNPASPLILASFFVAASLLLGPSLAHANFRASAGLGFGATSTSHETSESEGPLTQMYTIEFMMHSRLVVGAEHLRSLNLSPMSTAISFTGLFGRYYLNAAPSLYASTAEVSASEMTIRDLCYFVGIGGGLGQSNLLPNEEGQSSNAAGVYMSPRAGVELQLTRRLGSRAELMTAMTVFGKGSLSSFSLLWSLYYSF